VYKRQAVENAANDGRCKPAEDDQPLVRVIELHDSVVDQVKPAKEPEEPLPNFVLECVDLDDDLQHHGGEDQHN
jgi:hypothetical protein